MLKKLLSKRFIIFALSGGVAGFFFHYAAVCAGTT